MLPRFSTNISARDRKSCLQREKVLLTKPWLRAGCLLDVCVFVCLFGWLARPARLYAAVVMYYACAVGPTTLGAVLWCCERNSIVRFMDAPAYLLAEAVHLSNRRRRPTGSPLTVQQFNFLTSQPYALLDVITAPPPSTLVFQLYN